MPLTSGISAGGGDLPGEIKKPIYDVFKEVDTAVSELARDRGLAPSQVRLLRPCHVCVLVDDHTVFVVLTNINVGGMPRHIWADLRGQPMNLPSAIYNVERDGAFEQPFGFEFPRSIVGKEEAAATIAASYMHQEAQWIERQERIVRFNPIFRGRDYLLNRELVFMLSPFSEPYDTIYKDHIKPTVEGTLGLISRRADDIFDTRPIMEDIWQQLNEAGIVVAELTGRNPNVFYETGIAHTIGKEVILLTQTMDDVPFDLRHLRCIVYDYTPRGVKVLEEMLMNTITTIRTRGGS